MTEVDVLTKQRAVFGVPSESSTPVNKEETKKATELLLDRRTVSKSREIFEKDASSEFIVSSTPAADKSSLFQPRDLVANSSQPGSRRASMSKPVELSTGVNEQIVSQ